MVLHDAKWPYWLLASALGFLGFMGLVGCVLALSFDKDFLGIALLAAGSSALLWLAVHFVRMPSRRGFMWDSRGLVELRGRKQRVYPRNQLAGLQVLYASTTAKALGFAAAGVLGAYVASDLPGKPGDGPVAGLLVWMKGASNGIHLRRPIVSQRDFQAWLRGAQTAGLQVKHGH
jgi:hypothetical protein